MAEHRSRAPMMNPFEQLPPDAFDAFVTDISLSIKNALNPNLLDSKRKPPRPLDPPITQISRSYPSVVFRRVDERAQRHGGGSSSQDDTPLSVDAEGSASEPSSESSWPVETGSLQRSPEVVDLTLESSDSANSSHVSSAEDNNAGEDSRDRHFSLLNEYDNEYEEADMEQYLDRHFSLLNEYDNEYEEAHMEQDLDSLSNDQAVYDQDDFDNSFLPDDTFEMQDSRSKVASKGKGRAFDEGPGVEALHGISLRLPAVRKMPPEPFSFDFDGNGKHKHADDKDVNLEVAQATSYEEIVAQTHSMQTWKMIKTSEGYMRHEHASPVGSDVLKDGTSDDGQNHPNESSTPGYENPVPDTAISIPKSYGSGRPESDDDDSGSLHDRDYGSPTQEDHDNGASSPTDGLSSERCQPLDTHSVLNYAHEFSSASSFESQIQVPTKTRPEEINRSSDASPIDEDKKGFDFEPTPAIGQHSGSPAEFRYESSSDVQSPQLLVDYPEAQRRLYSARTYTQADSDAYPPLRSETPEEFRDIYAPELDFDRPQTIESEKSLLHTTGLNNFTKEERDQIEIYKTLGARFGVNLQESPGDALFRVRDLEQPNTESLLAPRLLHPSMEFSAPEIDTIMTRPSLLHSLSVIAEPPATPLDPATDSYALLSAHRLPGSLDSVRYLKEILSDRYMPDPMLSPPPTHLPTPHIPITHVESPITVDSLSVVPQPSESPSVSRASIDTKPLDFIVSSNDTSLSNNESTKLQDPQVVPRPTGLQDTEIPEAGTLSNTQSFESIPAKPPASLEPPILTPNDVKNIGVDERSLQDKRSELPDPAAPPAPTQFMTPKVQPSCLSPEGTQAASVIVQPPSSPRPDDAMTDRSSRVLSASKQLESEALPDAHLPPPPTILQTPTIHSLPMAISKTPSSSLAVQPPVSRKASLMSLGVAATVPRGSSPSRSAAFLTPLSERIGALRRSASGGHEIAPDEPQIPFATELVSAGTSDSKTMPLTKEAINLLSDNSTPPLQLPRIASGVVQSPGPEIFSAALLDEMALPHSASANSKGMEDIEVPDIPRSDSNSHLVDMILSRDSTPHPVPDEAMVSSEDSHMAVVRPEKSYEASGIMDMDVSHSIYEGLDVAFMPATSPYGKRSSSSVEDSRELTELLKRPLGSETTSILKLSPSASPSVFQSDDESSRKPRIAPRKRKRTGSIVSLVESAPRGSSQPSPPASSSFQRYQAKRPTPRASKRSTEVSPADSDVSSMASSASSEGQAQLSRTIPDRVSRHLHHHQPQSQSTASMTHPQKSANVHVTRSQCRFHKVSVPGLKQNTEIYFIVPGCALSATEAMEDEQAVDRGIATDYEVANRVTDLSNLDAALASTMRRLVGPELIHEEVCGYVPDLTGDDDDDNEPLPPAQGHRADGSKLRQSASPSLTTHSKTRTNWPPTLTNSSQARKKRAPRYSNAESDLADYVPPSDTESEDAPIYPERPQKRGTSPIDLAMDPVDPIGLLSPSEFSPNSNADPEHDNRVINVETSASTVKRGKKRSRRRKGDEGWKPPTADGANSSTESDDTSPVKAAKRRRSNQKPESKGVAKSEKQIDGDMDDHSTPSPLLPFPTRTPPRLSEVVVELPPPSKKASWWSNFPFGRSGQ